MIEFRHIDDDYDNGYRWDFVYLHGQAEYVEVESAGDLCIANEPMPIIYGNTRSIFCTVRGWPAVCVLHKDAHGRIRGRIALVDDYKGLRHVMQPNEWM